MSQAFPQIPFNKPFIVGKELYNIAQSVLNGHISGNGHYTRACSEFLSNLVGGAPVIMTPSCTAALEMALLILDIQPGDEVVLPSFTFVSTANAVVLRGGIPVFCDIREDTFNLDERLLDRCITPKTKAIMPVHYAGQNCDMEAVCGLAAEHGLSVVEDAAQGVGAYDRNRHLGSMGDMACFSFHETKNIMCGEGGALVINRAELQERAEIVQEKGTNRSQFFRGQVDKYTWMEIGSSYLPSELQMAFLYAQLELLEDVTRKRGKAYLVYENGLTDLERQGKLRRPIYLGHNRPNHHMYAVLCRSLAERSELISFLKARNIHAVFHYVPLHNSPAGLKFGKTPYPLTVTEDVADRLLRLPMYYEISEAEQNRVLEGMYDFYRDR
ncbi:dTDP-4-amino-4,6-dideoxygalactose transaminase [Sulfidibacter corallicola]|uniref:dTDP-4-amino-4,6-dideoxygalactose transaminase n=1 Tax=Sulfidibacter corallicola TaxID=2818388 RepID=A0A8A4TW09_SULCO|nr:dTDP-4-amino-4,6-dideoxygalactose transaminase [Sulfidibacter corallicola]QTD53358.1 dTDP-4-amino-4,6-dideoxygalactose transaminase [Sulfidibacter corallicola]